MWIIPWDLFLMKMLLKSEICGFINSAHCTMFIKKSQIFWLKKKKKKKETQNVRLGSAFTHPKYQYEKYYFYQLILLFNLFLLLFPLISIHGFYILCNNNTYGHIISLTYVTYLIPFLPTRGSHYFLFYVMVVISHWCI